MNIQYNNYCGRDNLTLYFDIKDYENIFDREPFGKKIEILKLLLDRMMEHPEITREWIKDYKYSDLKERLENLINIMEEE